MFLCALIIRIGAFSDFCHHTHALQSSRCLFTIDVTECNDPTRMNETFAVK